MLKHLTKNTKAQKFISFLIIIAVLVPTIFFTRPPQKVEAWGMITFSPAEFGALLKGLAQDAWKQAKMIVATKIINAIVQRTTNWINSGFHGNPFYLTNTESFFKDIVKFEVKNLVDTYAYNKTKFPFGKQFALDTINAYQRQATSNAEYSLSKVIQDSTYLENYRNDFNVGGWNGFLINTQYPQNNYIGFNMLASEEIARKLDGTGTTAAKKVQDTLQKSGGFLAPQKCESNLAYNNGKNEFLQPKFDYAKYNADHPYVCESTTPAGAKVCDDWFDKWTADFNKAKLAWDTKNACPGGLTTTTPGTVIADQIKTSLTSKVRQSEYAKAMGNGLAAIFDALMNKLLNEGLKKLSGAIEGTQNTDTFDYKGGLEGLPPNLDNSQICLDNCIAGAEGSPEQCNQSCVSVGGGDGGSTTNPLDFFKGIDTGGGGGGGGGDACTGGNPKCTCAENNSAYSAYEDGVAGAEARAYPNGFPSGTPAAQIQAAVCAAFTGPGSCSAGRQEDELIIGGLPAPYVTVSMDILIGGNPYTGFSSRAVAACEAGVQ